MKLRYFLLLLAISCANHSSTPAPSSAHSPSSPRPKIGLPCPAIAAADPEPGAPQSLRVFVELATLRGNVGSVMRPSEQEPAINRTGAVREFSDIINDSRLEVPSVASVMAVNDVPVTIPWDLERPNTKSGCPDTYRWDLTLTAHLDTSQANELKFEITLVPAPPLGTPPNSWFVPEHRRAHTTVVVANQQTVVLGGFGKRRLETEQSVLVLTPYLIRSDADMRRLFECKVKQARGTTGSVLR